MQGAYYKEWSRFLNRPMEFKVYGTAGTPVLALPCRGGRFYDWENCGMPDAIQTLLSAQKIQLFCADAIDNESLLAEGSTPRHRAEMQERYFNYLVQELAPRILALNTEKAMEKAKKEAAALTLASGKKTAPAIVPIPPLYCIGTDFGGYQAVNLRLRRPDVFAGAVSLSGHFDTNGWFAPHGDDLAFRNSPFQYGSAYDFFSAEGYKALADSKSRLILCAGQGAYEGDALNSTRSLGDFLRNKGIAVQTELWGFDVSHDWYWWRKQLEVFSGWLVG